METKRSHWLFSLPTYLIYFRPLPTCKWKEPSFRLKKLNYGKNRVPGMTSGLYKSVPKDHMRWKWMTKFSWSQVNILGYNIKVSFEA